MNPDSAQYQEARKAAIELLAERGSLRSPRLRQALLSVRREDFFTADTVEDIYDIDRGHTIKAIGACRSSATCIKFVTEILEHLSLDPGQRVLEIGTGVGYNAAVAAHVLGEKGALDTIEIDVEMAESAKAALAAAGLRNVNVILGNAATMDLPCERYDRIVISVAAPEVLAGWLACLREGGILAAIIRVYDWCYLLRGTKVGPALEVDTFHPYGFWNVMQEHPASAKGWFPIPGEPLPAIADAYSNFTGWRDQLKSRYHAIKRLPYPFPKQMLPERWGQSVSHPMWMLAHLLGLRWIFIRASFETGEEGQRRNTLIFASGSAAACLALDAPDQIAVWGDPTIYYEVQSVFELFRETVFADGSLSFHGLVRASGSPPVAAHGVHWCRTGGETELILYPHSLMPHDVDPRNTSRECLSCNMSFAGHGTFRTWDAACPRCGRLLWLDLGQIVQCKVVRLEHFGVVVTLGDGVVGLIHVSELATDPVIDPAQAIAVGETLRAKVVRVDVDTRRIFLMPER